MNIAITGITGLLGANLASALIEEGHHVRGTYRASSRRSHLAHLPIEWVKADVRDETSLARVFSDIDAVFHCAAEVRIVKRISPRMFETNVAGTRNTIRAAMAAGVQRLVHCSSSAACALSEDGTPVDESMPWNMHCYDLDDAYTLTKRHAEEIALEYSKSFDIVVVNPTYMFGPMDIRPSSGSLLLELAQGKIPGVPRGINNFADARDVARGMISALEKGKRGRRYILGGENLTYGELFERAASIAGVRPPRIPLPGGLARGVGRLGNVREWVEGRESPINEAKVRWALTRRFILSHRRAARELDYEAGSIDHAIRDAYRWFRERGML